MAYDCTMELLTASPALPPLEVLDAVRSMGHGLEGSSLMHSGSLQTGSVLPVCGARRGLHQDEGLMLQAPYPVVEEGGVEGNGETVPLGIPPGIVVPGDDVQLLCELNVIDTFIVIHEVGCDGDVRSMLSHCLNLISEE